MLTARILVYIVSQQVAFRIVRTESACTINVALLDLVGAAQLHTGPLHTHFRV